MDRKLGKNINQKFSEWKFEPLPGEWDNMESILNQRDAAQSILRKRRIRLGLSLAATLIIASASFFYIYTDDELSNKNDLITESSTIQNESNLFNGNETESHHPGFAITKTEKSLSTGDKETISNKQILNSNRSNSINGSATNGNGPSSLTFATNGNSPSSLTFTTNRNSPSSLTNVDNGKDPSPGTLSSPSEINISENTLKDQEKISADNSTIDELILNPRIENASSDIYAIDYDLLNTNASVIKPNNIKYSIGLFGGMSKTNRSLITDNPNHIEYQKRSAEEKVLNTIQYGINLNAKYKQIVFSTGLEVMQWEEEIDYQPHINTALEIVDNSYYDVKTLNKTVRIISLGSDVPWTINVVWKDSTYVEDIDTTITTTIDSSFLIANGKNKFAYYSIPLMIGYEYPLKHFTVGVQGGIALNFLKSKQGFIYSVQHENSLVDLKDNSTQNNNSLNIDAIVRPSIKFHLYKNVEFKFEGNFRFNINEINNISNSIGQKYNRFGGNIGLEFKL